MMASLVVMAESWVLSYESSDDHGFELEIAMSYICFSLSAGFILVSVIAVMYNLVVYWVRDKPGYDKTLQKKVQVDSQAGFRREDWKNGKLCDL